MKDNSEKKETRKENGLGILKMNMTGNGNQHMPYQKRHISEPRKC